MTDEHIIAYLLEELPEEELERFEDECFAQESWPAEVGLVEEDLIDAYLRGELKPERHQRFEQKYLTTEARQERVLIAAALLRRIDEHQTAAAASPDKLTWTERFRAFWSGPGWMPRTAAALFVVGVIAGAVWLLLFRAPSPRSFATLNLTISVNNRAEGAEARQVKQPLNADALKIFLMLPERATGAAGYRVELLNEEGETRPLAIAGQDAKSVSVVIPASQLRRGQYVLKLFMTRADATEQRINGSYFFTVQ
jgi:hypothetical protein